MNSEQVFEIFDVLQAPIKRVEERWLPPNSDRATRDKFEFDLSKFVIDRSCFFASARGLDLDKDAINGSEFAGFMAACLGSFIPGLPPDAGSPGKAPAEPNEIASSSRKNPSTPTRRRSHPPFTVLLSRDELLRKTAELGREICATYRSLGDLVVVSVSEGARVFCRELMQHLPAGILAHEILISSPGADTANSRQVSVSLGGGIDCAGRTVLLVEGIVGTGRTIEGLRTHLLEQGAARVVVATLLTKPSRREFDLVIGHQGFEIEDHFVIGFGMGVGGRYRELPEVALYDEALEAEFLRGAIPLASRTPTTRSTIRRRRPQDSEPQRPEHADLNASFAADGQTPPVATEATPKPNPKTLPERNEGSYTAREESDGQRPAAALEAKMGQAGNHEALSDGFSLSRFRSARQRISDYIQKHYATIEGHAIDLLRSAAGISFSSVRESQDFVSELNAVLNVAGLRLLDPDSGLPGYLFASKGKASKVSGGYFRLRMAANAGGKRTASRAFKTLPLFEVAPSTARFNAVTDCEKETEATPRGAQPLASALRDLKVIAQALRMRADELNEPSGFLRDKALHASLQAFSADERVQISTKSGGMYEGSIAYNQAMGTVRIIDLKIDPESGKSTIVEVSDIKEVKPAN